MADGVDGDGNGNGYGYGYGAEAEAGDWEAVVALMGPALGSGTPTPPPRSTRLPALAPTWTAAFRTRCV